MYKRIDKRTARKLYNNNLPVIITPCKCFPSWFVSFEMVNGDQSFDEYVNNFTYYNCCYELGYYPAFYIEGVI